jgi:hypothetical protein
MIGDGYVLNENLTDEYIQELITRCGFTDITPPDEQPYWIQDLDGGISITTNLPGVRNYLITQWLIQQNG